MFLRVCDSDHGKGGGDMHGSGNVHSRMTVYARGHAWQGMCMAGACMAGERTLVWKGTCVVGGVGGGALGACRIDGH